MFLKLQIPIDATVLADKRHSSTNFPSALDAFAPPASLPTLQHVHITVQGQQLPHGRFR